MEMQTELFAKQDSFGLRPWTTYASAAGVPNLEKFTRCNESTLRIARIDSGLSHAEKLAIPGTPTFMVNGWMIAGISPDSLQALVASELTRIGGIR